MKTHPVALSVLQVQLLVIAMHEVARVDGLTPSEESMIREFYDSCRRDADAIARSEALARSPVDAAAMRQAFAPPDAQSLFVQTCVLLGYADGHYPADERAAVRKLAQGLGLAV